MGKKVPIAGTDISSEKTQNLKGIALLLLMWHHLFGVEYLEGWSVIIPGTEGASYVIGASGKICLAMFLFCSGYGLFKSYISKGSTGKTYILKRLAKTLIPYWIVMIIAICYLIYAGKFEAKYIFVNLFALIHSSEILYVTFSWFIKLYVLLLLVLPLIKLIERKWKKNALIDILIYVVLPFALALIFQRFLHEEYYESIPSFLASTVVFLLAWFPLFAIGILFAKYNTYKKVREFADKFPSYIVIILTLLIIGNMFYLRFIVNTFFGDSILYHCCMADVFFGPVFVCAFLLLMDNMRYKSRYVLPFIGKNSVFYWLLSGMFFKNTIELSFLITWPKITILIFIWTIVLLTPFVFACSWISGKLIKLIRCDR